MSSQTPREKSRTGAPKMSKMNYWLSMIHAIVATFSSAYTLRYWDEVNPMITLWISFSYFLVIGFVEDFVLSNFLHHTIAIICSLYFVFNPKHLIVYVWFQFGEFSTPFLHLWKENNQDWAAYAFGVAFFLSRYRKSTHFMLYLHFQFACSARSVFILIENRIVFQMVFFLPYVYFGWPTGRTDERVVGVLGILFHIIQWYWMLKIVNRFRGMMVKSSKKQ